MTRLTTPHMASINTAVTSNPTIMYCEGFPWVKSCSRLRLLCTPNMLASTLPSTLRKDGAVDPFLFSDSISNLQ